MDRLHHEPGQGLLVLGVDGRGLEELGMKLRDALGIGLCAEICIDEFDDGYYEEYNLRTTIVYTMLDRRDQDVDDVLE
jgi:hypothetical protein